MNNYNRNSEFENIELQIVYDYDLARWEFQENFKRISSGYRQAPVYLFTDYGQLADVSSVSDCYDVNSCTYKDFRRACLEMCTGLSTKETITEKRRLADTWEDFFLHLLGEQTSFYECCRDGFPTVENAEILYTVIEVSGYCQGDYAYILVHKKAMFDGIENYLQNLVFNTPIFARVTINDVETDLIELAGLDSYDWDRDKVAEAVEGMEISEQAKAWIIENLPEYPAE
jgi:hypothetical protein